AAMTANAITYRGRSAVRDVGKVLGFQAEALNGLSELIGQGDLTAEGLAPLAGELRRLGLDPGDERVQDLEVLAGALQGLPRHLGQHSGGMVIAAGRLDEVVPLERA